MLDQFFDQIDAAMSNPGLQAALDNNYERRLKVRLQSYASLLEDVGVMRQRAHRARQAVVSNLDEHLERFIRAVSANGITVHRAADAAAAVEIVLDIARRNGVKLVAKAKTMLGEEIGINAALEKAGIEAIETDLGEYIVQLRGERPAHIITPAVHLRRSDVGQTFHEKLGIPYTDDVAALTAAARERLRQVFLSAGMGISGVNIGVVENGALCLLTNEGNGRLVCTLPPIHVALMGIERLVLTLDDLADVLYLLPRSATGQKLTVYTNLIRSPRLPGDPDGPQERHLVLVDNRRSALLHSSLEEALLCVRCGACLNICPAFREMGGHAYVGQHGQPTPYPGPVGSVLSPALFGYKDFGHLARACSLCGACREVCPVDINLPEMLLRVRAGQMPEEPHAPSPKEPPAPPRLSFHQQPPNAPPFLKAGLRLFDWIAASPARFHLAQRTAGLFSLLLSPASPWLRLPALTGWGFSKDFPRPALRPFSERWAARQPAQAHSGVTQPQPVQSASPADVPAAVEPNPGPVPLVERPLPDWFADELARAGGVFVLCAPRELAGRVLAVLDKEDLNAVQAWDGDQFPAGLLDGLRMAGIRVTHEADPRLSGGLTAALAGIAESGTLVLTGGPGRPLAASLLPRVHLAVLRATDIIPRLPQALRLPEARYASSTVLITGPSRTADIEMSMTIGMHGPEKLYVFCIHEGLQAIP
jgi:L-lactate dehydrogenase complex protein LldF